MEFRLPEIGEGVYEAELTRWLIEAGQVVKPGQDLLEVMTDKATMTVPAPFAGTILALTVTAGTIIKVGEPVLSYRSTGSDGPSNASPATTTAEQRGHSESLRNGSLTSTIARTDSRSVKASPSVRLQARKLGVNLTAVVGTGPDGRVLIEDLASVEKTPASVVKPTPVPTQTKEKEKEKPTASPEHGIPGTRMKLVGMRRLIAESMTRSKRTIPDYTYVEEVDITELVKLREQVRQLYYKVGIKLTYLPFWVKAAVAALKEYPLVNATLDEANNEIVLHDRYNIGVAVSTPSGLMVPVIHDADQKDIGTIARELERLSIDARNGTIKRDDLRGATFTVTSVGNLGGMFTTPVINHPEVGILGIGKMVRRPMYDANGNIRPADLVYFSYSFDHRVVDGAICAHFSNVILKQLANPIAMLLPANL